MTTLEARRAATEIHKLTAMTPEARKAFVKKRGLRGMARLLGVSTASASLRLFIASNT